MSERALRAFCRWSKSLNQLFGLKQHGFQHIPAEHPIESELATLWRRALSGQAVYAPSRWEVQGFFSHVPIGTFALFLAARRPWVAPFDLTATVILGDHTAMTEKEFVSRVVDPERRIGLGPWYEITAAFDQGPETYWGHGFYARERDPRRARLDHVWRRRQTLVDAAPLRLYEKVLFTGVCDHFLCRKSF